VLLLSFELAKSKPRVEKEGNVVVANCRLKYKLVEVSFKLLLAKGNSGGNIAVWAIALVTV
jgi:hypothetical protein